MENLQQIVVQETTAPFRRALAQYGSDFLPEEQIEITYDNLSQDQKKCYDDFIEMIKSIH
jgi:hypothetical protein